MNSSIILETDQKHENASNDFKPINILQNHSPIRAVQILYQEIILKDSGKLVSD
jgi:hypothetical protein